MPILQVSIANPFLNPIVRRLYDEWLEEPGSEKAKRYIHTEYHPLVKSIASELHNWWCNFFPPFLEPEAVSIMVFGSCYALGTTTVYDKSKTHLTIQASDHLFLGVEAHEIILQAGNPMSCIYYCPLWRMCGISRFKCFYFYRCKIIKKEKKKKEQCSLTRTCEGGMPFITLRVLPYCIIWMLWFVFLQYKCFQMVMRLQYNLNANIEWPIDYHIFLMKFIYCTPIMISSCQYYFLRILCHALTVK